MTFKISDRVGKTVVAHEGNCNSISLKIRMPENKDVRPVIRNNQVIKYIDAASNIFISYRGDSISEISNIFQFDWKYVHDEELKRILGLVV